MAESGSPDDDAPEEESAGAEEGPPEAAAEEESLPKRRKRRRRRPTAEQASAAVEEEPEAPPVDERVPAFARGWPRDEGLDRLVAAFEAGDYARVRREAPVLARATEDDAVRRAARELARRLDPDPLAVYMLIAAVGLLVFLAGWYWLHPHTP